MYLLVRMLNKCFLLLWSPGFACTFLELLLLEYSHSCHKLVVVCLPYLTLHCIGIQARSSRASLTPGQKVLSDTNTSNQKHKDRSLRLKNKKVFQKLKLWCANADTLTSSKLNELQTRTNTEHPEAYPKNSQFEVADASLQLNGYDMFRT